MQGMRHQWLALAVLALCLYWSSSIEGLRFVPIYDPLTIKIHRDSPPHIAFEEIYEQVSKVETPTTFHTVNLLNPAPHGLAPKPNFELPVMTLSGYTPNTPQGDLVRNPRISQGQSPIQSQNLNTVQRSVAQQPSTSNWQESLSASQKLRLEKAQADKGVLDQDWSLPTWKDLATQKLKEAGLLQPSQATPSKIHVSGGNGKAPPRPHTGNPENANETGPSATKAGQYGFVPSIITGQIEITGGLAVTNEQTVELHRVVAGQVVDFGTVNVQEGTYAIDIAEPVGDLVALLTTDDGSVIGKGVASLDDFVSTAPVIKINPRVDFSIASRSAYDTSIMGTAPAGTKIGFLNDESVVAANSRGVSELHNAAEGSSTLARIRTKGHIQTNLIAISGQEMSADVFPESMIKALIEIVNSQRGMTYERPSIIWGRIKGTKDGMPGIQVLLESAPYLEPVYFDDFMIPDLNLKATGGSGLFAFIGPSEGFHSLAAYRDEQLIGYQNTVVEEGTISIANVEIMSAKQTSLVRVYDAFMGSPQAAKLSIQALNQEIFVNGETAVQTSQLARLGLLKSAPVGDYYLSARYVFNELQKDIFVPLIPSGWLINFKNGMKFPDAPGTGTILGFVPHQDYEVYIAGVEDISNHVVYFDSNGQVVSSPSGVGGGGFALFNLPAEVTEVVVLGSNNHKMETRIVPVDPDSLSVLTFMANP